MSVEVESESILSDDEQIGIWQMSLTYNCDWKAVAYQWNQTAQRNPNFNNYKEDELSQHFFTLWTTSFLTLNRMVGQPEHAAVIKGLKNENILSILELANQKTPKTSVQAFRLLMELLQALIVIYCKSDYNVQAAKLKEMCIPAKFEAIILQVKVFFQTKIPDAKDNTPYSCEIQYNNKVKMSSFKDIYIKLDLPEQLAKPQHSQLISKKEAISVIDHVLKKRNLDYWQRMVIRSHVINRLLQS